MLQRDPAQNLHGIMCQAEMPARSIDDSSERFRKQRSKWLTRSCPVTKGGGNRPHIRVRFRLKLQGGGVDSVSELPPAPLRIARRSEGACQKFVGSPKKHRRHVTSSWADPRWPAGTNSLLKTWHGHLAHVGLHWGITVWKTVPCCFSTVC